MWLGSCVAMAVAYAGSCSSYLTPSVGLSIYHRCDPKKQSKNKNKNKKTNQKKSRQRDGFGLQAVVC